MNRYKFGEFETDFDVTDVAFIEKYEEVTEKYTEELRQIPENLKASEKLRAICGVFFRLFDRLFGEGTSSIMFGDKLSVDLCARAFKELIEKLRDYSKTLENMRLTPVCKTSRRTKK